jgi:ribosomal RNA methyltransferase Nop2
MKKQGPPEPLSEEHFASLKRKKGLPVDDAPAEAPSSKKRRTATTPEKSAKGERKEVGKKGSSTKQTVTQTNGTKKSASSANYDRKGNKSKTKRAAVEELDSDEEMDDEFADSDLNDTSGAESDVEKLNDDFLGSDDSVYDSDQGDNKKEKFVFSDDEDDEDDREEKLTAANIEGLSRKLDEKLAEEAAENEAELREAALQTNIDGDKPHILGDGDDEDELSAKTKNLLAPDLQMLRTRITETIRVLEDFSNLAEEGRSRAEYMSQLLKDICACMQSLALSIHIVWTPLVLLLTVGLADYGYNEFLAEKLL